MMWKNLKNRAGAIFINNDTSTELYKELPPNNYVESSSNGSHQLEKLEQKTEIQPFLLNETAKLSVADAMPSASAAMAQMLENLGVGYAFGVAGGAMASLWNALSNSNVGSTRSQIKSC
ncbi:hypothetical protein [Nodularia sp. NIES-3585]|uniref:hypothetical protein n=1 Tax=Nodularia sp. NIES-3585 TaxID=1973477 RepID=UPI000B72F219|nr:thiamine pyrophosphate binding domain-containing protein [Nodularia sp. NIES-3585]